MPGTLTDARLLAEHTHRNQKDKAGRPYMEHVSRVAAMTKNEMEEKVAWLHDTVEDGKVSVVYLKEVFGKEVADAVRAISHMPCEPLLAYYARVKANPLALAVKFYDLADNSDPNRLKLLEESTMIRLTIKYQKAFQILRSQ